MTKDVPYSMLVVAYRNWKDANRVDNDLEGFFKFLGVTTLDKQNVGGHAVARLPEEAAQRVDMLLGPNANTIVRVYLIQKENAA